MITWQEFLLELDRCDVLRSARALAFEEYGKDIPITLLFGRLGRVLADHTEKIDADDRAHVFQVIENGMASSEKVIKAYVATGLLEALYSRASRAGRWKQIEGCLGPLSTAYLMEWREPHS